MPPAPARARTPLPVVFALTWFNSLAASAITVGIPFIVKSAYRFGPFENLLLGLVIGLAYVPGASLVGPALRRLTARVPGFSTRRALLCVLLTLATLAALPRLFTGVSWIIWPVVGGHMMVSGALWPIIESYLSGGRSGETLRRATTRFNVCWSSASFAVMWLAAPLVESHPLAILSIASVIHALTCVMLPLFGAEPGRHAHEEHESHPPIYQQLLVVFRWLLPTGYVMAYCLNPLMPSLVERVHLDKTTVNALGVTWAVGTLVGSAWLFSRIGTFALFAAWSGWHGRWWVAGATGATMLAGFAVAVTASQPAALVIGLLLFGLGIGGVYASALYYALEVGQAEVDAGGKHEALIGLGYTVGPIAGLVGYEGGRLLAKPEAAPWLTVAAVALIAFLTVGAALRHARRVRGT